MSGDSLPGLYHHIELLISDVCFQPYVPLKLQVICNISDANVIYLQQCDFSFQIKSTVQQNLPAAGINM